MRAAVGDHHEAAAGGARGLLLGAGHLHAVERIDRLAVQAFAPARLRLAVLHRGPQPGPGLGRGSSAKVIGPGGPEGAGAAATVGATTDDAAGVLVALLGALAAPPAELSAGFEHPASAAAPSITPITNPRIALPPSTFGSNVRTARRRRKKV